MKVTHKLNSTVLTKSAKDVPNFLLTNKIGGYCLLGENPISRYQGVFLLHNSDMFKVIEDIRLIDGGEIKEVINKFAYVKRKREGNVEEFFMPYGYDALMYELEKEGEVEVVLDVRRSYANPEFGRVYDINRIKDGVVVSYQYENEKMFLVVKFEGEFEILDEWVKRDYWYDKDRNTHPYEKYVYKALRLKSGKIVVAFFPSKKQAMDEANYVFRHHLRLKEHQKMYVDNIKARKPKEIEIRMAKKCAISSLNKLVVNLKGVKGIIAGLPWFFQFWTRDELISSKALLLNHQNRELKEILLKNLGALNKGFLPNISLSNPGKMKKMFKRIEEIVGVKSGNADSVGWLFKRVQDSLGIFSTKEKMLIKSKLVNAINYYNKNLVKNGLVYNSGKKTWMDSEFGGDDRAGYRIEIQALFLNMLKLAYELTKNEKYSKQEQEMREKVKEKFWNGKYLADGLDDFTIRPNVFIAAYIYPSLLERKKWEMCFEKIVPRLWLNWGGVSSIDKKHELFVKDSTGEDRRSYHRGDSWFWVNNLAALVLYRVNKRKFGKYIEKIIQASAKEILTSGAIGHSAEISSASGLRSQGCMAQAWSDAMFIELVDEIY